MFTLGCVLVQGAGREPIWRSLPLILSWSKRAVMTIRCYLSEHDGRDRVLFLGSLKSWILPTLALFVNVALVSAVVVTRCGFDVLVRVGRVGFVSTGIAVRR